jgi:hypothetical protein
MCEESENKGLDEESEMVGVSVIPTSALSLLKSPGKFAGIPLPHGISRRLRIENVYHLSLPH